MNLFDHELTPDEALHLDSLIDTGSYDPYLLLVGSMLKDDQYLPTKQQSETIMKHIGDSDKFQPKTAPTEHVVEPKISNIEHTDDSSVQKSPENKNPSVQYIKLPDASVQFRKHKQKQSKTKSNNESSK